MGLKGSDCAMGVGQGGNNYGTEFRVPYDIVLVGEVVGIS